MDNVKQENIPHHGSITLQAIVHKQMPNGMYSPEAVFHDTFTINFTSDNAKDCITELKRLIQELKDARQNG